MSSRGLPPRTKLAAARLWATRHAPYFSSALLALVPREAAEGSISQHGTLAVTSGGILLWEPSRLERWSVPEIGSVLLHEVSHILRDHAGRCERGGHEHKLWNLAGDAEINDDLVKIKGVKLPDRPVMPSSLGAPEGRTAEEYYHKLLQNAQNHKGGPGAILAIVQSGGSPSDKIDPKNQPIPAPGGGWCGGCSGNPTTNEPDGPNSPSGKPDPQARSKSEIEDVKRQVAAAIQAHAKKHGKGSVPGGWERWSEVQLQPAVIPWQTKLRRLSRLSVAYRPGAVDVRYSKPSRRQYGLGFGPGKPVIPSYFATQPQVAIVLDTSGSMGSADVSRAASESKAVIATIGGNVTFCACDSAVHSLKQVKSIEQLIPLIKGGGGTSFVPAFEALEAYKPRPELVVFITDGCGDAPPEMPSWCKVIWLLVGPCKQKPMVIDKKSKQYKSIEWGEFIEVD